eukprot:1446516-Rhodomonas_salina.1
MRAIAHPNTLPDASNCAGKMRACVGFHIVSPCQAEFQNSIAKHSGVQVSHGPGVPGHSLHSDSHTTLPRPAIPVISHTLEVDTRQENISQVFFHRPRLSS